MPTTRSRESEREREGNAYTVLIMTTITSLTKFWLWDRATVLFTFNIFYLSPSGVETNKQISIKKIIPFFFSLELQNLKLENVSHWTQTHFNKLLLWVSGPYFLREHNLIVYVRAVTSYKHPFYDLKLLEYLREMMRKKNIYAQTQLWARNQNKSGG